MYSGESIFGMEKWGETNPGIEGNEKNNPSSKGLEKGWKTNYTFFSNILEALINEIIYSS